MLQNQITIGPDFFQGEVRNYSNLESFYRELVQNSIDVNSTKIDIHVTEGLDGTAIVKFIDNGPGMSKETLEQVFFRLGATTKNTTGTIGGFGKARILLCFAQDSYTIRTRDLLVHGSGAGYTINENQPWFSGCEFNIIVSKVNLERWGGYDTFLFSAKYYLEKCQLSSVNVTVNGAKFGNWLYKRHAVRTLSFGTVYVNKSNYEHRNRILLRVSGALMSSIYISASVLVIVEIDPAKSRDVLLSNRDSLVSEYQVELDKFIQEVARDSNSSLKAREDSVKTFARGTARRFTPRTKKQKKIEEVVYDSDSTYVVPPFVPNAGYVSTGEHITIGDAVSLPREYNGNLGEVAYANSIANYSASVMEKDEKTIQTSLLVPNRQNNYSPVKDELIAGMVHYVDTYDMKVRSFAKFYKPDVISSRRRTLLKQWLIAVEYALEALTEGYDSDIDFRIGFYFHNDVGAIHETENDGSHSILLNPVDALGKMAYSIIDSSSFVKLVTLAVHEVTHIEYTYHDENFSSLMTKLIYKTMAKMSEIGREMKAA